HELGADGRALELVGLIVGERVARVRHQRSSGNRGFGFGGDPVSPGWEGDPGSRTWRDGALRVLAVAAVVPLLFAEFPAAAGSEGMRNSPATNPGKNRVSRTSTRASPDAVPMAQRKRTGVLSGSTIVRERCATSASGGSLFGREV